MKTKIDGTDMTINQLGNSDLFISPLGFGAWVIGCEEIVEIKGKNMAEPALVTAA